MSAGARVVRILGSPMEAWARFRARDPERVLRRNSRSAARLGIRRLRIVFSFDCDTDEDAQVVARVDARLREAGIRPAYAVAGELLERHAGIYRTLHATGAEFINHGYRAHARIDPVTGGYASSMFYDKLTVAERIDDIRVGDDALRRVLGIAPTGFRTPHFGTFQAPQGLEGLHRWLVAHGYRFSSSTVPLAAFRNGVMYRPVPNLVEIPLGGTYSRPVDVLDTYGFCAASGRTRGRDDYLREFRSLVDWFRAHQAPGVLNLYGDPLHVQDWPAFFAEMQVHAEYFVPGFAALMSETRVP